MATIFIALLMGIVPREDIAREYVDLIEVNHFYDEHARLVFDQVLFYEWSEKEGRFNVRAWRLVREHGPMRPSQWFDKFDEHSSLLQTGEPLATMKHWECRWMDGQVMRIITAPSFKETWTQYDPELIEREHLPKEKRRGLKTLRQVSKPKKK